jgi:hypothetical protein
MALKIERICNRKPTPSGDATEQYQNIVQQLAAGDEPDFQQVVMVLAAVGKTATELASDVAAKQQTS